jgi:hypothetical protein
MVYMSVKEASLKWGVSEALVRRYCSQGRIEGTLNEQGSWRIPIKAKRPGRVVQTQEPVSPFVQKLLKQKEKHIRNGIYSYIQINLTYSNSRMASNRLTRIQVDDLFHKDKLREGFEPVKVCDIIEVVNHFMCTDYILENANSSMTHTYVKKLHYLLKYASYSDRKQLISPGDYRSGPYSRKGVRSSREFDTAAANNITPLLSQLFKEYEALSTVTLEDLLDFHVRFERIHPFDDGNGRIGRLLLFKECLRHSITPFIIDDKRRGKYLQGLKEWDVDRTLLLGVCKESQERFVGEIQLQKLIETHINFQ